MYRGDEATRLALDTFIKLMRASDSFLARMLAHGPLGERLTMSRFAALEALYHHGPLCPGEIAAKVLKTKANMTTVIDNLEREGLVTRTPSEEDRRKTLVTLTAEGATLIAEVFPRVAAAIRREMGLLSPDEQTRLGELCKKLGTGGTQPAGTGNGGLV